MSKKYKNIFCVLLVLSLIFTSAYSFIRISLFLSLDIPWTDKIFSAMLLIAELFILLHGMAYALNVWKVIVYADSTPLPPSLKDFPPVAVVVSSYKEPIEVVDDILTCFYNLSYPNKQLYFLDDTRYDKPWDSDEVVEKYKIDIEKKCAFYEINLFRRKWHDAKAGMLNDFLEFIQNPQREGFKYFSNDHQEHKEKPKYMIVFDVDMNPTPNFIESLVEKMEKDPQLAFIQTPQYYSNFETNRVAKASGLMQAVFYEFICEAKGMEHAMICCGTNVIFRLQALYDVGGFDHTSVTEDFATSFQMHVKKWKSSYYNHVIAFGMGPEDLGSFFKQQYRWAFGTIGLFRKLLISFIKNPRLVSFKIWWHYLISSTYYFIGWVFFVMVASPILYLFFDIPLYFVNPLYYFLFFIPYIVFSNLLFYLTLSSKRYPAKDIFNSVLLASISFPIFMRASLSALMGLKTGFVVTPKGGSNSLPLWRLWPQISAALLSISAVTWGVMRLFYEQEMTGSLMVNMLWSFYYFVILSVVIYLNHPVEEEPLVQIE